MSGVLRMLLRYLVGAQAHKFDSERSNLTIMSGPGRLDSQNMLNMNQLYSVLYKKKKKTGHAFGQSTRLFTCSMA